MRRARQVHLQPLDARRFQRRRALAHLAKVNRAHLPDMVAYMKRRLLADWSDINFIIGTNPEDYVELRFLVTDSGDAISGLHAYMNTFVNSDEKLSKYMLRKVTQF